MTTFRSSIFARTRPGDVLSAAPLAVARPDRPSSEALTSIQVGWAGVRTRKRRGPTVERSTGGTKLAVRGAQWIR